MYILYLYDLKAPNKRKFNRTKRMFYYYLNKLPIRRELWKTKSALVVPARLEKKLDFLFERFSKEVSVYKVAATTIERMY